jgi:endonuclease-3
MSVTSRTREKAARISEILDSHFPDPAIPLAHHSPYTLLIAVLLSAQCTDARVNTVTPALFTLADTPKSMASKSVAEVEAIIKPCGLAPQKAKAIVTLSKILVERFNGRVPKTLEELQLLPGVGRKTASVVLIQAFDTPAFPVDTHIHRLAFRWGLSTGKDVTKTEQDLRKLFPQERWAKLHLQMIYFGRAFCPARGHEKKNCPICSLFGRKEVL